MTAKTAIKRKGPSAPLKKIVKKGLVSRGITILDHGCGHGADVRHLESLDIWAAGYDPNHRDRPVVLDRKYHVVLSTYVANVLQPSDRNAFWAELRGLVSDAGYVILTVRTDVPPEGTATQYRITEEDIPPIFVVRQQWGGNGFRTYVLKGLQCP